MYRGQSTRNSPIWSISLYREYKLVYLFILYIHAKGSNPIKTEYRARSSATIAEYT